MRLTGLYTTSISGSSNSSSICNQHVYVDERHTVNLRTLVRAGTAISLGNAMLLRERVRTPLIPRSDSLHHRIRVVFNRINERERCDARRAEDTKSQG